MLRSLEVYIIPLHNICIVYLFTSNAIGWDLALFGKLKK